MSAPPAPKAVKILLPIWGEEYIAKFTEVSLPTWLAERNLPGVAAECPTEFVFLTSERDAYYLRESGAVALIAKHCPVRLRIIDHLITGTNYSTTLTLAYEEAVRAESEAMLDTCFFFMVADYIIADGSLLNAYRRIAAGARGVQVGNFQVVEETASDWLFGQLRKSPGSLSLQPRLMMKWGFAHLHPTTLGNTVNLGVGFNLHSNRLFWFVDNETMIGRFYLMHMLCIRPETTDFVIAASCDYSFMSEMVPSGNFDIITDSDEYLNIELQARGHEARYRVRGSIQPKRLARRLSEWTTEPHRRNAQTSVVFHTADLPPKLAETEETADRFVKTVAAHLDPQVKPIRNHPYWAGGLASFKEATGVPLADDEWPMTLGWPAPGLVGSRLFDQILRLARKTLIRRPPHYWPWHPLYVDNRALLAHVQENIPHGSRVLIVSDRATLFSVGLHHLGYDVARARTSEFIRRSHAFSKRTFGSVSYTVFEIYDTDGDPAISARFTTALDKAALLLEPDGKILVSVKSTVGRVGRQAFADSLLERITDFRRPYAKEFSGRFVTTGAIRWKLYNMQHKLLANIRSIPRLLAIMPIFAVLSPIFVLANLLNARATGVEGMPRRRYFTSALFMLSVDPAAAAELRKFRKPDTIFGAASDMFEVDYGDDSNELAEDESAATTHLAEAALGVGPKEH